MFALNSYETPVQPSVPRIGREPIANELRYSPSLLVDHETRSSMRSTKPYCQLGGLHPFAMELGNCYDQGCSCNKLLRAMQYKGLRTGLQLLAHKLIF